MSTGSLTEEYYFDPKNYQICAHQEDTSGGWREIGIAYCRSDPSDWMIEADTGGAMLPSFKLQFAGNDTACSNHIFLTSLVPDSEWVDTAVSATTAIHWVPMSQGMWDQYTVTTEIATQDQSTCQMESLEQIAMVFPAVSANPDTTMVRDYVLEFYGVYTSQPLGSPSVEERIDPVFTYDLEIKQIRPFSRRAAIFYQVPRSSNVSLKLYDASGRLVRTFVSEQVSIGKYSIDWDGTDKQGARLGSGTYFFRIIANDFNRTQKLVIID